MCGLGTELGLLMDENRFIHIHSDGYLAVIDLKRGANCISLRNCEYNAVLLREPPEVLDNPYLYGMPILFPVNRISGGEFTFEGREYKFPINEPATGCHLHGTLHETEFSLAEKTDSRICCVYRADAQSPYLQFPHSFSIRIEYELSRNGLRHTTWVENLSESNMPVLLGFHTTFNARFCAGDGPICVRVPIATEYERNMKNYLPTGNKPAFDDVSIALNGGTFDPFSLPTSRHYRSNGDKMTIYDEANNLSLVYENDEKFGFRLIYNGNADGYICLEPQTSLANSPNYPVSREEACFGWLAPGKTASYTSRIFISEGDLRE